MKVRVKADENGSEANGFVTNFDTLDFEKQGSVPLTIGYDYHCVVGSAYFFEENEDGEIWCELNIDDGGVGVTLQKDDRPIGLELRGEYSDKDRDEFNVERILSASFVFNHANEDWEVEYEEVEDDE